MIRNLQYIGCCNQSLEWTISASTDQFNGKIIQEIMWVTIIQWT